MAAAPPPMVTCPICLECLTDPVVLDCGHSFCQGCITKHCEAWEALGGAPECPTCKAKIQKGDFRRNWQLANLLEKMKLIPLSSGKEDLCLRHKKKYRLFCKEDEEFLCLDCQHSPKHKAHKILLLEEAAQHYKDHIHRSLDTVKNERNKILASKADAERESQDLLKQTELDRENIVVLFRQLHEFLADQEKLLLFQLENIKKDIARARDEHLATISKELSSLESLIQEMEEKHQQTDMQVLKDVRSTLQRYQKKETFENPVAFPPGLKWRLWNLGEINHSFQGILQKFQDSLVSGLLMRRANVTLNPTKAGSKLILSEDWRSVKHQREDQDQPQDLEDIYDYSSVLGSEEFTSGCHFWEVSVGSEDGWAVGVARKYKEGRVTLTPEEGIWIVGRSKGQYKAFIRGINPPLTLHGELKRIRVSLNYAGGQVAFFDADRATLLYKFFGASFSKYTICPFFTVYDKGCLRLCP